MFLTTIALLSGGRIKKMRVPGGSVKVDRIQIFLCKNVKCHTNLNCVDYMGFLEVVSVGI